MPTRFRSQSQPEIADVLTLAAMLDRDERRPVDDRTRFDRDLASGLGAGAGAEGEDRLALGLAWMEAMRQADPEARHLHQKVRSALHWATALVVALGLLVGWVTALGAFFFDGSGRVNAVAILAVFVLLPGLLLLPFVFAVLPDRFLGWVPGAPAVAALARAISPGRLAALAGRLLPGEAREAFAGISGRLEAHQRLQGGVQKWSVLRWSQMFALGFQVAAMTAAIGLVIFTDLAFGWSTTLTSGDAALDALRVHRFTSLMAAPWSWAIPGAAPSPKLIGESRYFRVAAGPVSLEQAARLGSWWPFLAMSMLVYGLLPRVLTLAIAQRQWQAALRVAFADSPEVSAWVRRLHRAQVETAAIEPEVVRRDVGPAEAISAPRHGGTCGLRAIVNWSGVPVEEGWISSRFPSVPIHAAGGLAAVEQDAALAERLGRVASTDGDVLILVKGWEPPLLEFLDFVKAIRMALGRGPTGIVVLPVGMASGRDLTPSSDEHVRLWQRHLARAGDPWLRVAANPAEVLA